MKRFLLGLEACDPRGAGRDPDGSRGLREAVFSLVENEDF